MKSKSALVIVLTALFIASGYAYQWMVERSITHDIKVTECQISTSICMVSLGGGKSIEFDITPRGIPTTQALSLRVLTHGLDADEVLVSFEGIEINHHLPPYILNKVGVGQYVGKGFLSLCVLDTMHWLAHVSIQEDGVIWRISLPFKTHKS
ncbi:hypothetical protein [Candidatus Thioglobus sp.]|uniref:hypothetical protein n=1 Tax=Candidatus Thioglobus sp. TaxID=2026721 RepID=UPI001DCB2168|nr:hypothetical protein [Candidatus Thioglobus sp.]MBT3276601.1 hypothetical protein [Candidatus Thioglobus sp.]MBT3447486.1 hypothetical protein [Candidatus Thioglobus sp.]MBT3744312.1 hypothetical protein [Candidatus Thioglobus sp.]MBT4182048.1 hypothetical protein [Candidatus Thioglobus sp.]MBT4421781.1 hypothetical protein [Candidatus Thioglobus sp.]